MKKVKATLRSSTKKSSSGSRQPSISSYFQGTGLNEAKRAKHENEAEINANKQGISSENGLQSAQGTSVNLLEDDDVIFIDEVSPSQTENWHATGSVPCDDSVSELKSNEITFTKDKYDTHNTCAMFFRQNDISSTCDVSANGPESETLSQSNKISDDETETPAAEPYYHQHFLHIVDSAFSESENEGLFNDSDVRFITTFKELSEQEQNLYIRFFQRKHKWIRDSNLKYSEISEDLLPILEKLFSAGLLQDCNSLQDLGTVLKLLLLPELKVLSKQFNIAPAAKGKEQIQDAFLAHCRQQTSIKHFFNSANVEKKVLKKAKELVGRCFKLVDEARKVFVRLLLLFSLTGLVEDEENSASGGQQKTLVTLLMVDKGHLKFPEYNINKQVKVFEDRDSLIRYQVAKQLEIDLLNAFNTKNYQEAYELYLMAKELYSAGYSSGEIEKDSQCPSFLQRFTSSHVYVRCLNHGVDVLQKMKNYQDAVDLLWILLRQEHFCQTYRGHWWDRLTLITDYHLRCPKLTLSAIRQSLSDARLRLAHEYSLRIRAQKIIKHMRKEEEKNSAKSIQTKTRRSSDEDIYIIESTLLAREQIQEAPKVNIVGFLLPGSQTGFKNVFVLPASNQAGKSGEVSLLSVEELALNHYKQDGYSQGIHGEGSTVISLFCLLFWNIIYGGEVADVFRNSYQSWPLDLNTDNFYSNRRKEIDLQIHRIECASKQELQDLVESCWQNNVGTNCLMNWDLFTGSSQVKVLNYCILLP